MDDKRLDRLLALRDGPVARWLESQKEHVNDPGPSSFQTGPGRIIMGAFVPSGGPGGSVARVAAEETVEAEVVPIRLLRSDGVILSGFKSVGDGRVTDIASLYEHGLDKSGLAARYVDPEQTASRTRHWDDAA